MPKCRLCKKEIKKEEAYSPKPRHYYCNKDHYLDMHHEEGYKDEFYEVMNKLIYGIDSSKGFRDVRMNTNVKRFKTKFKASNYEMVMTLKNNEMDHTFKEKGITNASARLSYILRFLEGNINKGKKVEEEVRKGMRASVDEDFELYDELEYKAPKKNKFDISHLL